MLVLAELFAKYSPDGKYLSASTSASLCSSVSPSARLDVVHMAHLSALYAILRRTDEEGTGRRYSQRQMT